MFSDQEAQELRRMLAAFKQELPPHELGGWRITTQPTRTTVEDEAERWIGDQFPGERLIVRGHTTCVRCNRRFDIPNIGNFTVFPDSLEETIIRAKEGVARLAERAGPCWGDVPEAEIMKRLPVAALPFPRRFRR